MTRVKGGTISLKRRKNVLKQVKGYRFGRSTKGREAREAIAHAGAHAFAHRRDKKNDFRRLWNVRLNAALRPLGFTYSKFIGVLKKKNILLLPSKRNQQCMTSQFTSIRILPRN